MLLINTTCFQRHAHDNFISFCIASVHESEKDTFWKDAALKEVVKYFITDG